MKAELNASTDPLVAETTAEEQRRLGPCVRIELSYAQRSLVRALLGRRFASSLERRAFVEGLVAYASRNLSDDMTMKVVRRQLRWLIAERTGVCMGWEEVAALMEEFTSRKGRPARVCELARLTSKGTQGIPSTYELTGLLTFFEEGRPTSVSVRPISAG